MEELKRHFVYNPETGEFTRVNGRLKTPVRSINARGYQVLSIGGKSFYGHRLAWLYVHGVWPENTIDHINGIKSDNRIANLRDVCELANHQNIKHKKPSRSGVLGAIYCPMTGRYKAAIKVDGVSVWLGRFDTPQEAHDAFVSAKRALHIGCTI